MEIQTSIYHAKNISNKKLIRMLKQNRACQPSLDQIGKDDLKTAWAKNKNLSYIDWLIEVFGGKYGLPNYSEWWAKTDPIRAEARAKTDPIEAEARAKTDAIEAEARAKTDPIRAEALNQIKSLIVFE